MTNTDAKEHDLEDHDMTEPHKHEDTPKEVISHNRRPAWDRELIQDVEKYLSPDGSLKESKRPRTYSSYVALLSNIIDAEPSIFRKQLKRKYGKMQCMRSINPL